MRQNEKTDVQVLVVDCPWRSAEIVCNRYINWAWEANFLHTGFVCETWALLWLCRVLFGKLKAILSTSCMLGSVMLHVGNIWWSIYPSTHAYTLVCRRLRLKCDATRAETRFRLSAKRASPFKSAGASVQSTTGSRGVRISGSNAGYTMFRGSVKGIGDTLHSLVSPSLPLCASSCAIAFQLDSTT